MTPERHLDSPRNPWVKGVLRLRERRERDRSGTFVVEGAREVERALAAGLAPLQLALCPSYAPPDAAAELAQRVRRAGGEVVTVAPAPFDRMSLRQGPDGVLLVARQPRFDVADLRLPADPFLLVVDGVEKPGNLGALLRSADAVGVDAVLVSGAGTDLCNPNVVRASMGSLFAVPLARLDADELRALLARLAVRLVATTPAATRAHWEVEFRGAVAIVLGTEHSGLDAAWLGRADERIRIPMRARAADSLNVAVAGSVVLYEALRQRTVGT